MIEVFHCKVSPVGQVNPAVVQMHARIAFRVDRQALTEILNDEAAWRDRGLSFELVAHVESDDLERAFAATNHIDRDWSDNPDVEVKTTGSRRSTSVGDLVVRDGLTFVVGKFGFTYVSRPAPAEVEVEHVSTAAPRG